MKFEMVNESCHEKSRVTAAASEASISDHLSSLIHNNNDAVFLSAVEGATAATLLNPFIALPFVHCACRLPGEFSYTMTHTVSVPQMKPIDGAFFFN